MMSVPRLTALISLLLALVVSLAFSGEKLTARLRTALAISPAGGQVLVWVRFTDKGVHETEKASVPLTVVSPASIQRRLTARHATDVVDYTDLPVDQSYVVAVNSLGLHIRQVSKWFNAVSASATPGEIQAVASLPFVGEVDLVGRFRRAQDPEAPLAHPDVAPTAGLPRVQKPAGFLDYGLGRGQLNLINVLPLHGIGNHAEGVIIGVFDDGVRLLSHHAFDTLRSRIVATRDFVDHKESVIPNDPNTGFGYHGVETLSAIGGYAPGQVIGPAFAARYILARTENDSSETPIEEDNWVAAIEWADSLGVQVTSTSLEYLQFDPPYESLTWLNMNGRTAIISIAATMAAEKGIVVVTAAGNDHRNVNHNTLGAPGDADSVLTVGAVDQYGVIADFSSQGPTIDGRTKPDVVAQGMWVRVASSTDPNGYDYSQGTSFSTPLAAGAAALLVKAFPSATPMEIINALRNTASRASHPDNVYGWGIIDALAAYEALLPAPPDPTVYSLLQNFPNPFNGSTFIEFNLPEDSRVRLRIFDVLGRRIATLVDEDRPARQYVEVWSGTSDSGTRVASGTYYYILEATGASGNSVRRTGKMILVK